MKVTDPQVFADIVRVTDLVLSCLAAGALGYALLLFWLGYRDQVLRRADASLLAVVLFAVSYWALLLAGIASDIQRVHSGLTAYLPIHIVGAAAGVAFLLVSASRERGRLRRR